MNKPQIKELREGASLSCTWKDTTARRLYYLYYEYIPNGGVATAFTDMREYLQEQTETIPIFSFGFFILDVPVFHKDYKHLMLNNISINQEGIEPKYIATVEYSTPERYGFPNGILPPWAVPWTIETNFFSTGWVPTHADIIDIWNNTYRRSESGGGKMLGVPLVNTAGCAFDNPPEEELFVGSISLRGARIPSKISGLPPLTLADLNRYIGSINCDGDQILGLDPGGFPLLLAGTIFPPFTCRVRDLSIKNQSWEDIDYQEVGAEIEVYNPPYPGWGWFRTVIDQGPYWLDENGKIRSFTILNEEEEEETADVEQGLNGRGKPRGWDYTKGEVDPSLYEGEGPTFIQFNTKPFRFFRDLGLPRDARGYY
jgi:hypothetical protein